MKDRKILALYRARDPRATTESRIAYGEACRQLAINILDNAEEADAVFTEVLEKAVEDMAETGLCNVQVNLLRATHRRALEVYWQSEKTRGRERHFSTVTEELSECAVPMDSSITLASYRNANRAFVGFFNKLGAEGRDIFICRYFYGDTLGEISRRFGISEEKVAAKLARMRQKFHKLATETELYVDEVRGMTYHMESLPPAMLVAAHGDDKRFRKMIPWIIAGAVVVAAVICYPYLQEIINTDLTLRGPDWRDPQADETLAEEQKKPLPPQAKPLHTPVPLGATTLTATAVTETTLTLRVEKGDDTPIYAMIYDGIQNALASTEEGYKVDGALIRYYTLKLSVDGGETVYALPAKAGTYEVVVDFSSIRNGNYPMLELLGIYAYIGEDETPVTVSFDLTVPEEETTATDTEEEATATDTEEETTALDTAESDTESTAP